MIKTEQQSQLLLQQAKLNSRHSELLANQTELNTKYLQQNLVLEHHKIKSEKTFIYQRD